MNKWEVVAHSYKNKNYSMPFVVTKKTTYVAGKLNKYADVSKRELEKKAMESGIIDEYKANN